MGSQSMMTFSVTSLSIMTILVFMTRAYVTLGASLPDSLILPKETKCKEYSKSISPSIAQNTNGQIKFIQQMNSTHVDVQRIDVVICEAPGSSCVSCRDLQDDGDVPDKVCQQRHRLHSLWVLGDTGRDHVLDQFSVPDGCQCVTMT